MFAVSRAMLTWTEANTKCRSLGGELLSIGDKEEQEFIQTNVIPEKSHYWIGFTDQENEGTWQWTDRYEATVMFCFRGFAKLQL